jgi:hypothetical protein
MSFIEIDMSSDFDPSAHSGVPFAAVVIRGLWISAVLDLFFSHSSRQRWTRHRLVSCTTTVDVLLSLGIHHVLDVHMAHAACASVVWNGGTSNFHSGSMDQVELKDVVKIRIHHDDSSTFTVDGLEARCTDGVDVKCADGLVWKRDALMVCTEWRCLYMPSLIPSIDYVSVVDTPT